MTCDLCEEEKESYRGAHFGTKDKRICTDCLAQFKVTTSRVILHDRYLTQKNNKEKED